MQRDVDTESETAEDVQHPPDMLWNNVLKVKDKEEFDTLMAISLCQLESKDKGKHKENDVNNFTDYDNTGFAELAEVKNPVITKRLFIIT
jgi:hypothetical protein